MRPQAPLWCFVLCAVLLAGCATSSGVWIVKETRQPGVIVVKETNQPGVRIVEEPVASGSPIKEAKAPVVPSEFKIEVEPVAVISPQGALDQALARTVEGLRQFRNGAIEEAHKSLTDANLMLLDVNLSGGLATSGLNLFHTSLPKDLQIYDPEAILQHLDQTDVLSSIERIVVDAKVRPLLSQLGDPLTGVHQEELIAETYLYIQYFKGQKRQFFETVYLRKHKYWPTIRSIFAEMALPADLGYMAFVESGFQPRAASGKAAVGVWQFIPDTGREYGLQSPADFHDVERSTRAAAAYLYRLTNQFGPRLLAVAAYNCGEGCVTRCLRKIGFPGERSFWGIRSCLPLETQRYVPQILAAAVIGADPKLFGFDLLGEKEMRDHFDIVEVQEITSLAYLAELAGTDVASLRRANSELARLTTTPGRHFPLYVPKGKGPMVIAGLAAGERRPSVAPLGPIEGGRP